jgi:hypothetical protein
MDNQAKIKIILSLILNFNKINWIWLLIMDFKIKIKEEVILCWTQLMLFQIIQINSLSIKILTVIIFKIIKKQIRLTDLFKFHN